MPVSNNIFNIFDKPSFIILFKNFINYFINIENCAYIAAIIYDDIYLLKDISNNPINMFINEYKQESLSLNKQIDLKKSVSKVIIDISNNQKKNQINKQINNKFNPITVSTINNLFKRFNLSKIYGEFKNPEINGSTVNSALNNIVNITMLDTILKNMSKNDITTLLNSDEIKNILSQLYILDSFLYFGSRMYGLILVTLLNNNKITIEEVKIRIQIINKINTLISNLLKTLNNRIKNIGKQEEIVQIPSKTPFVLVETTYNKLINNILNSLTMPKSITDMFVKKGIKLNSFTINNKTQLEFFTQDKITNNHNNNQRNMKYFWITILLLIIVILYKIHKNKYNKK